MDPKAEYGLTDEELMAFLGGNDTEVKKKLTDEQMAKLKETLNGVLPEVDPLDVLIPDEEPPAAAKRSKAPQPVGWEERRKEALKKAMKVEE